ncbi:ParA family protein [Brackiella oedipodis]|uniref:ParA family protein n=1 Tax=Brackiella oedipodis TaxID=124225 RepID=UPI00048F8E59|nr:AAA family ATPase [Brackiella oedipodis]
MSDKAKILCIANQKGGVGKTTTATNLSAVVAAMGKKVLLIDIDPQGNATMGSGIDKSQLKINLYDILIGQAPLIEAIQHPDEVGYDVLPSNRELAGIDIDLADLEDREFRLKKALKPIRANYDYIFIDCPPTLSLLTLNALAIAHGVIIPMQCEYFALEGLSDLVNTVKRVYNNINPELLFMGILRVMYDPRITLQQQVSEQLEQYFGDNVFKTVIPRNVRLAEAPSYGLPGVLYDKHSRGAKAYSAFGKELIQRIKKKAKQKQT